MSGLGFAALRDVASFVKTADKDDTGTANPLKGDTADIYSACVSQPCRTMHDFVTLGFNADESNRKVVDGVVNWIGGATSIFMNYRFAEPFRTHRQHISRRFPEFQGPFTNQVTTDIITGKTDGKLKRCLENNTRSEDLRGELRERILGQHGAAACRRHGKDIGEPDNVRSYLVSSLPHNGGAPSTGVGYCQLERNPLVANGVLRARYWSTWMRGSRKAPSRRRAACPALPMVRS